jgi:hypothetical protein
MYSKTCPIPVKKLRDKLIETTPLSSLLSDCYEGSRRLIETNKLKSVMQNPLAAKEKIENEIQNRRIAGPFSKRPIWNLRCSPVGNSAKKDFRLSTNNSFIISTI